MFQSVTRTCSEEGVLVEYVMLVHCGSLALFGYSLYIAHVLYPVGSAPKSLLFFDKTSSFMPSHGVSLKFPTSPREFIQFLVSSESCLVPNRGNISSSNT